MQLPCHSSQSKLLCEMCMRICVRACVCFHAYLCLTRYCPMVCPPQVFIIRLLGDRKFEHFRSVLDAYIDTHFSGAMAHKYETHVPPDNYHYQVLGSIAGTTFNLSLKLYRFCCHTPGNRDQGISFSLISSTVCACLWFFSSLF